MAIDDDIKNIEQEQAQKQPQGSLESSVQKRYEEIESKRDKKSGIFRILWDAAKYGTMVAGIYTLLGPAITAATYITTTGFVAGSYFDIKKQKKKFTWKRFYKELVSGQIMGLVDYAVFSLPEFVFKFAPWFKTAKTWTSRIALTALFNPTLVYPYNAFYQTMTHLRDNVGVTKTFTGLFNGKIFGYLKEAKDVKLKKELKKDTWNVFKWLFPLHFIQMNYLPNAPLRMTQSLLVNGPLYRIIMGRSDREKINNAKNKQYAAPQYPQYAPSPA